MTQVLSTVSVAKNPWISFPLVKLFRLSQANPRATTATLSEATAPMDTAMLTVILPIATGLMGDYLLDQVLVKSSVTGQTLWDL